MRIEDERLDRALSEQEAARQSQKRELWEEVKRRDPELAAFVTAVSERFGKLGGLDVEFFGSERT